MNRDINALEPVVAAKCRELIRQAGERGVKLIVTSTMRTQREQRALYAQGRRTLGEVNALRRQAGMGPIEQRENQIVTGAHTSMHQFGCAFDVAIINHGRAVWDEGADINADGVADYEEAGQIGQALGLRWGGGFASRDLCHFEYTGGLTLYELKAGMRPGLDQADALSVHKKKEVEMEEEMEMEKDKTKAGLRSSEFYLALLGAVLPVLNTHLGTEIPVSGVMSIAGVIISYILSRTVLKRI